MNQAKLTTFKELTFHYDVQCRISHTCVGSSEKQAEVSQAEEVKAGQPMDPSRQLPCELFFSGSLLPVLNWVHDIVINKCRFCDSDSFK